MRRWLAACLLASLYVALWHAADLHLRCQHKVLPELFSIGSFIIGSFIIWSFISLGLFVIGLGLIAVRALHLNESRLRDRIIGSVLLAILPSVMSLIMLYGVFEGRNTIRGASRHMLAEFPLRLLAIALLTFAGVSVFRGLTHFKHRPKATDKLPESLDPVDGNDG